MDEMELAKQFQQLEEANQEVGGDDSEDDYEEGMGEGIDIGQED